MSSSLRTFSPQGNPTPAPSPRKEPDLLLPEGIDLQGRFRVSGKLSSGGMSDVYRGLDLDNGNSIAIKIAAPNGIALPDANRFIGREELALGKLRHPNIVSLFGGGEVEGRRYLVLEYLEGDCIGDRVQNRPFTWPEASGILCGLCDALAAVHVSGAVHGDLTANNVSISRASGGAERPVLLDFGFVKFMDPALDAGRTPSEDIVLGTLRYLAPEQAFRSISPDFDHRADIYSFGVLAYRMLSGCYPFDGPSDYSILLKHRDETPSPLDGLIPPEANRIVLKALAKDPRERFQSAPELRTELERLHFYSDSDS